MVWAIIKAPILRALGTSVRGCVCVWRELQSRTLLRAGNHIIPQTRVLGTVMGDTSKKK